MCCSCNNNGEKFFLSTLISIIFVLDFIFVLDYNCLKDVYCFSRNKD